MNVSQKGKSVNIFCFSCCVDEKMEVDSLATEEKTSEAKTEVKAESSEDKPSTTDNKVCRKSVDVLLVNMLNKIFSLRYESQR